MNSPSFMDRILVTGAVGITLTASLGLVVAAADLICRVHERQSWTPLDHVEQWAEIPLAVLTFLVLLALPVGACLRLVRRRNVLRSFSEAAPSPLTPRSKYAVWSDDWRSAGRPARFGALRTRKRVRRPQSLPPQAASVHVPSAAPQPQTLTIR